MRETKLAQRLQDRSQRYRSQGDDPHPKDIELIRFTDLHPGNGSLSRHIGFADAQTKFVSPTSLAALSRFVFVIFHRTERQG